MSNTLIPNTFQHANAYVDWLSYYLTPQEEKVLNKAIREIIGWRNKIVERKARIALSVFVHGKKKNGEQVCMGCGLGESAVRKALSSLDKYKILCKVKRQDGKNDVTFNGQEFYLQESWDDMEWELLRKRRAEWDNKNKERVQKALEKKKETGGIVTQQEMGVVTHTQVGIVAQQQRNPVETHKKPRQQPNGCDFDSLIGIKVIEPINIQKEYAEVELYQYASEVVCPECNHHQEWPKSNRERKKKKTLTCGDCGVIWRVTIDYDTGGKDVYKVPLSRQEWIIIMESSTPKIGNRFVCNKSECEQFVANWKENPTRVMEKLLWAASQDWLIHQRTKIVSRVNAAYETTTEKEIKEKHQELDTPSPTVLYFMEQTGKSREEVEQALKAQSE